MTWFRPHLRPNLLTWVFTMSPASFAARIVPTVSLAAENAKAEIFREVGPVKRVALAAVWPVLIRCVLPFLVRFAVEILVRRFGPRLYPILAGFYSTGNSWLTPDVRDELGQLIDLFRTAEAVHPAVAQAYRVEGVNL